MNTYTCLIIYLSICAIIIIFIPAVRRQWKGFITSIPTYYRDIERENYTNLKEWRIKVFYSILLVVVVPIFFVLTLPILPLLIKYNKHNRIVDKERANEEEVKDNNLYFWWTNGVGNIQCLDCNYQEKIVSFIHGLNSSSTGLQCQSCGKFHALNRDKDETIYCECAGILEREEPIFCPKCKSKKMKYRTHYMT